MQPSFRNLRLRLGLNSKNRNSRNDSTNRRSNSVTNSRHSNSKNKKGNRGNTLKNNQNQINPFNQNYLEEEPYVYPYNQQDESYDNPDLANLSADEKVKMEASFEQSTVHYHKNQLHCL